MELRNKEIIWLLGQAITELYRIQEMVAKGQAKGGHRLERDKIEEARVLYQSGKLEEEEIEKYLSADWN